MKKIRLLALSIAGVGAFLIGQALYIPAKAALAQVLLERAWDRAQAGDKTAKPWPWADITPVAKIDIPKLDLRAVVLNNASGEAMAFGPGRMAGTADIGSNGTSIVVAHRDTHFRELGRLKPGDMIEATNANGGRTEFRVVETRIVHADASGLDPHDGGPSGSRLALVTCYPFTGMFNSPLRYVVLADRQPGQTLARLGK